MTERQLKYALGVTIIISHVTLLLLCIALYFLAAFTMQELTTLLAIVVPVFSVYTTSVVSFVISDKHIASDKTNKVTNTYAVLSFAFPLFTALLIGVSVIMKAYNNGFDNFEDFKRFLITIETLFGAYMGALIYSLFGKPKSNRTDTTN
ncbi:hypothetical protein [Crenobacter cavernae]|uniref:hypothetical protein n=1 Tax=Crenobacter cavernae TaxID=2290923 RepID=UPI0011C08084|nr:hypothetical protein [Crenobacter cavernae]